MLWSLTSVTFIKNKKIQSFNGSSLILNLELKIRKREKIKRKMKEKDRILRERGKIRAKKAKREEIIVIFKFTSAFF